MNMFGLLDLVSLFQLKSLIRHLSVLHRLIDKQRSCVQYLLRLHDLLRVILQLHSPNERSNVQLHRLLWLKCLGRRSRANSAGRHTRKAVQVSFHEMV